MSNLSTDKKESYNDIPVYYCKKCLSLKIRQISSMGDLDYCEECGSTCIENTNIDNWETIYKNKYGHKYLETYHK